MNAFEESLVALIETRVKSARAAMSRHARFAVDDPREAMRALGDAHGLLNQLVEDVGCLRRLHEMAEDLERQEAAG